MVSTSVLQIHTSRRNPNVGRIFLVLHFVIYRNELSFHGDFIAVSLTNMI